MELRRQDVQSGAGDSERNLDVPESASGGMKCACSNQRLCEWPADGSISIDRPNVRDNKLIDCGKYLVLDSMGITARCPCLDDCFPDENASGILAAHALTWL